MVYIFNLQFVKFIETIDSDSDDDQGAQRDSSFTEPLTDDEDSVRRGDGEIDDDSVHRVDG